METINNMATAAAKAVWGEGADGKKEEPVSGVQGDTSKGEPFDAGNIDANGKEETTTKVGGSSDPAEVKPSSSAPGDSTKGQNDVRDPEDATTDHKTSEARKNVDDSGEGIDNADNPVKVDGPGPKPIDEVAKEHGGDAGRSDENVDKREGDSGDAEAPADDGEGDGPQKQSHGEGTGEQYVKSSGLQADGGDFDATKPGAGREADRLLEEKGVHNPAQDASKPTPAEDTGSPERKEKKSLKEKIKDKLHKN